MFLKDNQTGNQHFFQLTDVPYNLTFVDKAVTVKDVVITPVKIAIITRPVKIQITANRRPGTPTGAISPYLYEKRC